jgi:phosphonate transport system permease protein
MTPNSKRSTVRKQNVSRSSNLALFISTVIPGSGQFYLKQRWRGGVILLTTAILAFVISWGMENFNTLQVIIGGTVTSWLWLPFILFWAWNIWDTFQLSVRRPSSAVWGALLAALILFVMSWDVTDARPERLISNFNAARTVVTKLVNPDIITFTENGEDKICAWDCLLAYARGDITGELKASSNFLDIIGRVEQMPVPRWQTALGLAPEGATVQGYTAGKMIETIAIGLLATLFSTILAVPLSFLAAHNIMSRVPGGMAVYYAMRTFLNVVRAVDPVIWGTIIIIWVGLGPFAGVIALTVHSIAALGKLYSEEIEHIDPGPVEAIRATGGNLLQVIRFAVIPQIIPPFLGYTLLRWDINMRSATVIGFVAGGGIGFFVVETIQMGGYQQYAAALWVVAVVIILVDYISSRWRENILKDQPPPEQPKHPRLSKLRKWVYIVLGVALFLYCINITEISLRAMFDPGANFGRVFGAFLTIDLSPAVLPPIVKQMLVTIFQAMLATAIGALAALPFSFLAAKNLTGRSRFSAWVYYITRSLFNVLRSIEALLYVAIFVYWVSVGPFAGSLALAITTFALIGKLFSEAIENIDPGPMEAINATGASRLQAIRYAIVPQIVPPFLSYLIYQWDINIRMATIIGFAGGGGVGLILQTYLNSLQYHKAGTVVLFIVIIVALMDFSSAKLREKLV